MRMHVNKTKTIAVLGVLAALSTVCMVLGTVISVNTIFFTAAAAFLAGIVVCRFGVSSGAVFSCVCLVLDFIVNPNKLNALLYLAFAGYILLSEGTWKLLPKRQSGKRKEWLHRVIRLGIFEVIYLPLLIYFPSLFVSADFLKKSWFHFAAILVGIAAWIVFDLAYGAAKRFLYSKFPKI